MNYIEERKEQGQSDYDTQICVNIFARKETAIIIGQVFQKFLMVVITKMQEGFILGTILGFADQAIEEMISILSSYSSQHYRQTGQKIANVIVWGTNTMELTTQQKHQIKTVLQIIANTMSVATDDLGLNQEEALLTGCATVEVIKDRLDGI